MSNLLKGNFYPGRPASENTRWQLTGWHHFCVVFAAGMLLPTVTTSVSVGTNRKKNIDSTPHNSNYE